MSSQPVSFEESVPDNLKGLVSDWSSDVQTFKVRWSKAMMWIFLVSDTFIFGSFLSAYMAVRLTTTVPWPNTSEVFALHVGGADIPLLLIAIMTFILISSSGTMAMAVTSGYKKQRVKTGVLILLTALGGLAFVGMQMFEWSKLIFEEGIRPWGNDFGANQFGGFFFMITGFHGLHVSIGVIYLTTIAVRVLQGRYDRLDDYQIVEVAGLYWHFVDLVWIFIFAFFYLW
ncbi:MAG: bb3-type cytochrome oxidase subunit IV [Dehalococcoidia bacterium]|jgi:cytochrome c oxidase subunit 3|nr:bb3-type cytochrome oxidase subunit IV [Dehalococcoidia bacterium]|tara:strand:- start:358 stop:1044 length:687 start_codon:yes stop_codon:yes gene_type:complete